MQLADIESQLLHLLLLNHEVLPVEHLDLGFVLALLELGEEVAHLLKDTVFLDYDVVFFFGQLRRLLTCLQHALLGREL